MAQISYGTITITDVTDGANANIWTASVAPTTPNYTFTISNLTGPEGEPRVGDIILQGVYRYTITEIYDTTVLAGSRQSLQGATGSAGGKWYTGTGITGTSTTATAFSGSGVSSAVVGDMYLNTSTDNVYRCTVAGNASTAKWVYTGNIKGSTGSTGRSVTKVETEYYRKLSGGSAPTASTSGSTTIPDYVSGCTYYTRTVTYFDSGDPNKGSWQESTALTNEIKNAYDAWIAAGNAELKVAKIVENADGLAVTSGVNGGTVTPGTPSTYGYNTLMAPNYLGLRYNAINLAKLTTTESTPALEFYIPTVDGGGIPKQGVKGVAIDATGLKIYNPVENYNTPLMQLSGQNIEFLNLNGDVQAKFGQYGAYIPTLESQEILVGDLENSRYWRLDNSFTDYTDREYITLIGIDNSSNEGEGNTFVQPSNTGFWRLGRNRIHTGWYNPLASSNVTKINYKKFGSTYFDVGIKAPSALTDKTFYIRHATSSNVNTQSANSDTNWTYKFYVDGNGNVHAPGFYIGDSTTPIGGGAGTTAQKIINSDNTYGRGSSTKPIYIDSSGYVQESNSDVGGGTQPIYMSGGTLTASTSTVGGTTTPIYLKSGVITALGYTIAKSVPSNAIFTDQNVYTSQANTAKIYLTGTQTGGTSTTGALNFDSNVYLTTTAGVLHATTFEGNLSGTATKANQDGDGNVIKTTYLKLSGGNVTGPVTFGSSVSIDEVTVGDLVVNGAASFTNNLQANTINGVAVGSSPKFTDTTYSSLSAASGGTAVSLVTTGEKYTWNNKIGGSGTSGYLAKFNGTGSITNGPQLGSATNTFLRNDGTWATPVGTTYSAGTGLSLSGGVFNNTGVTGVKGNSESSYRTGQVNLTAANIGLGNVNNTSDADKPISTATQTALNNKQSIRVNNTTYNPVAGAYVGGSGINTYARITLPTTAKTIWGMYLIEVSIRGDWQNGKGGKVLINAYHNATSPYNWLAFNATVIGYLPSTLKVYGGEGQYFYINFPYPYQTVSIDKVLVGDTAAGYDLSAIAIDFVDTLPDTYQTATMYYGDNPSMVNGHTVASDVPSNAKFTDTWNALSTSQAGYVAQAPNDTSKFLRGDATWAAVTKSNVGLGNLTNDKQVKGLSSGTTSGHLVSWGADGYTVTDSGIALAPSGNTLGIVSGIESNTDGKLVLTYANGTKSNPISVKIIGTEGSSVSYAEALTCGTVGSATVPVYFNSDGVPATANTIPKLNNTTTGGAFYAPTGVGSNGQILISSGSGAPTWTDPANITSGNKDEKIKLTNTTGNADYRVLLSYNANDSNNTEEGRKSTYLKFNPSSGLLKTYGISSASGSTPVIYSEVSWNEIKAVDSNLTTSSSDSDWLKALLIAICTKYPSKAGCIFKGTMSPNSVGWYEVHIYNTSDKDATTNLPRYSFGRFLKYINNYSLFGTADYSYSYRTVDTNTTYSAGTGISLSGTTFSNSGVRSISTGSTNGTISVNTNGTSTDVAVKGLGSNAYTSTAYLPLTGGTITGNLVVKGTISNNNYFMTSNVASFTKANNSTGTIKIVLPFTVSQYDMPMFDIYIYEYNSYAASHILIGGHNWPSGNTHTWYQTGYTVSGAYDKGVRLANDGTHWVILLGNTTTTWTYVSLHLKTVFAEYTNNSSVWATGTYTISQITDETGIVEINSPALKTLFPLKNGTGASGTWGISISGNAATATNVAWSGVTGKPINFITNTGALNTNGWKTLGGRVSQSSIAISYASSSPATWNSQPYSASIVFGCADTKGMLDVGYSSPIVTFGGASVGSSTDDAPKWYFKLSGTSGQTYTFPSSSKTLAATDGTGASGTWGISISGNAATATKATKLAQSAIATEDNCMPSGGDEVQVFRCSGPTATGGDGHIIGFTWSGAAAYGAQIYLDTDPTYNLSVRQRTQAGVWQPWKKIFTENNYNSFVPTLTGTGASGTWGISISGTAAKATADKNGNDITTKYVTIDTDQIITAAQKTFNNAIRWGTASKYGAVNYNSSLEALVFSFA